MNDLAKLNDLARAEIEQLGKEGIRLTPEEVVEINALGWAVQTPETRRLLSRGRPVPVAGVMLWPLTLRALDWLERNKYPLDRITAAMGYAMCFGRSDGDELDCEGREAEIRVSAWFRKLPCTQVEFAEAVQQVDDQEARPEMPPDPDGNQMSIGDFSAFLTSTCGADADFWERRCSLGYCLAVMATLAMQNHADKRPCASDPRIVATRALGWAVEKVKARHALEASTP